MHTDPSGDRRLVGYLTGAADPAAVAAHLAGLLPPTWSPASGSRYPSCRSGPTGKVDRAALPAPRRSRRPRRALAGWPR